MLQQLPASHVASAPYHLPSYPLRGQGWPAKAPGHAGHRRSVTSPRILLAAYYSSLSHTKPPFPPSVGSLFVGEMLSVTRVSVSCVRTEGNKGVRRRREEEEAGMRHKNRNPTQGRAAGTVATRTPCERRGCSPPSHEGRTAVRVASAALWADRRRF